MHLSLLCSVRFYNNSFYGLFLFQITSIFIFKVFFLRREIAEKIIKERAEEEMKQLDLNFNKQVNMLYKITKEKN